MDHAYPGTVISMTLAKLSAQARTFAVLPLIETPRHDTRLPIVPSRGRPPRVHLWHIGCQMNDADREMIAERLREIGCLPECSLEDADLVILITCTVRQNAEQKVYGKFRELTPWKREREGRAIAMTGCMAVEHGEQLLRTLPDLDYVFDVRDADGFFERLQQTYSIDLDGPLPAPPSDRISAYVSVMGGCNEMCTYCIVPFVRGRESSRRVEDIVEQVRRLVDSGVREVTLLGQNVNSYMDPADGRRLWHLLEAVDQVPGLARLRFLTSHPRNATRELFAAMRDLPTVCEALHLPVQAGHDDLLRRMRRVYTVAEYRERIAEAREMIPDLSLSTDIIVGFAGETPDEFAGTRALLEEVGFDVVHLQAYSVRPGTAAARRPDDIPTDEKKRRLNELLALQKECAGRINARLLGEKVEVLLEGRGEDGRMYGRSRQNRMVWCEGTLQASVGDIVAATVTGTSAWQLEARVEESASA